MASRAWRGGRIVATQPVRCSTPLITSVRREATLFSSKSMRSLIRALLLTRWSLRPLTCGSATRGTGERGIFGRLGGGAARDGGALCFNGGALRVGAFCVATDCIAASAAATAAAAGGSLRDGDGLVGGGGASSGTGSGIPGSGIRSGATIGGGAGGVSMCIGVGGVLSSVSEQSIIWFPLLGCAHEGTPVHEARRIAPVNNKAGATTGKARGCGTGEVSGEPGSRSRWPPRLPRQRSSLALYLSCGSNLCLKKARSCMQNSRSSPSRAGRSSAPRKRLLLLCLSRHCVRLRVSDVKSADDRRLWWTRHVRAWTDR